MARGFQELRLIGERARLAEAGFSDNPEILERIAVGLHPEVFRDDLIEDVHVADAFTEIVWKEILRTFDEDQEADAKRRGVLLPNQMQRFGLKPPPRSRRLH